VNTVVSFIHPRLDDQSLSFGVVSRILDSATGAVLRVRMLIYPPDFATTPPVCFDGVQDVYMLLDSTMFMNIKEDWIQNDFVDVRFYCDVDELKQKHTREIARESKPEPAHVLDPGVLDGIVFGVQHQIVPRAAFEKNSSVPHSGLGIDWGAESTIIHDSVLLPACTPHLAEAWHNFPVQVQMCDFWLAVRHFALDKWLGADSNGVSTSYIPKHYNVPDTGRHSRMRVPAWFTELCCGSFLPNRATMLWFCLLDAECEKYISDEHEPGQRCLANMAAGPSTRMPAFSTSERVHLHKLIAVSEQFSQGVRPTVFPVSRLKFTLDRIAEVREFVKNGAPSSMIFNWLLETGDVLCTMHEKSAHVAHKPSDALSLYWTKDESRDISSTRRGFISAMLCMDPFTDTGVSSTSSKRTDGDSSDHQTRSVTSYLPLLVDARPFAPPKAPSKSYFCHTAPVRSSIAVDADYDTSTYPPMSHTSHQPEDLTSTPTAGLPLERTTQSPASCMESASSV